MVSNFPIPRLEMSGYGIPTLRWSVRGMVLKSGSVVNHTTILPLFNTIAVRGRPIPETVYRTRLQRSLEYGDYVALDAFRLKRGYVQ